MLNQYLSWRPVLTVDQFWIAALKILPYEITGAYGIIDTGYLATKNAEATGWLFVAVIGLSIFVLFLHRAGTGASRANALAMAVLFLLFALSMNANAFRMFLVDETVALPHLSNFLQQCIDPFPILIAAVFVVLGTAGLRKILAKPPT